MGLDMMINNKNGDELAYWRKEPAIHKWFEKLACKKSISFDNNTFNGVKVPLNRKDLENLVEALRNKSLDYGVSGFFFGSNLNDSDSESWYNEQIEIIQILLDSYNPDDEIYYDSSW